MCWNIFSAFQDAFGSSFTENQTIPDKNGESDLSGTILLVEKPRMEEVCHLPQEAQSARGWHSSPIASMSLPPSQACLSLGMKYMVRIWLLAFLFIFLSLCTYKVPSRTNSVSRHEDLDVFGSQYSAATPATLYYDSHVGHCSDIPLRNHLPIILWAWSVTTARSTKNHSCSPRPGKLQLSNGHFCPTWDFPPQLLWVGFWQRGTCSQDMGLQLPQWAGSQKRHRMSLGTPTCHWSAQV